MKKNKEQVTKPTRDSKLELRNICQSTINNIDKGDIDHINRSFEILVDIIRHKDFKEEWVIDTQVDKIMNVFRNGVIKYNYINEDLINQIRSKLTKIVNKLSINNTSDSDYVETLRNMTKAYYTTKLIIESLIHMRSQTWDSIHESILAKLVRDFQSQELTLINTARNSTDLTWQTYLTINQDETLEVKADKLW